MATVQQIADLRVMVNQPLDAEPYTDVELAARIDAMDGTLQGLAGAIWREKAGSYAGLVDVQEGSSRRSLSGLQANALKMADSFSATDPAAVTAGRAGRTRAIERP